MEKEDNVKLFGNSDLQKSKERLQKLTLKDDFLFSETLKHKEISLIVLNIILRDLIESPIETLDFVQNEVTENDVPGSRGVRLDIVARAGEKIYNIEMQQDVGGDDLFKRVRYYQGKLDRRELKEGQKFKELPETFIIVITIDDFISKYYLENLYSCTRYVFRETQLLDRYNYSGLMDMAFSGLDNTIKGFRARSFDNGRLCGLDETSKIFVNMESKNGDRILTELLDYMKTLNLPKGCPQELMTIDKQVKKLKEDNYMIERYRILTEEERTAERERGERRGEQRGELKGKTEILIRLNSPFEKIYEFLLEDYPELTLEDYQTLYDSVKEEMELKKKIK